MTGITGNFWGFWLKRGHLIFAKKILQIENLDNEKKVVCITGSNNWSDVSNLRSTTGAHYNGL
jgi:hypothetical protein